MKFLHSKHGLKVVCSVADLQQMTTDHYYWPVSWWFFSCAHTLIHTSVHAWVSIRPMSREANQIWILFHPALCCTAVRMNVSLDSYYLTTANDGTDVEPHKSQRWYGYCFLQCSVVRSSISRGGRWTSFCQCLPLKTYITLSVHKSRCPKQSPKPA